MVDSLIEGVSKFRRGYFNKKREKYQALVANGQRPHTLFVCCADSRILPHAITQSDPGDLFVMRNVGNMVPPMAGPESCPSTGAAIEYATSVLGVSEIVVCGHSHCGACAALFNDHASEELALTHRWIHQGRKVRDLVLKQSIGTVDATRPNFKSRDQREQLLRATEKAMVVQHMANLMTYPAVARRVAEGSLALHGWHYTIESGLVEYYDAERLAFLPLEDRHAAIMRARRGPLRLAS